MQNCVSPNESLSSLMLFNKNDLHKRLYVMLSKAVYCCL